VELLEAPASTVLYSLEWPIRSKADGTHDGVSHSEPRG
jgi:hypothetical protein